MSGDILVTGANGFIGQRVAAYLSRTQAVRCLVRREDGAGENTVIGDLDDMFALHKACQGVETVVHCAGYAHDHGVQDARMAARHWRVNHGGTRNLLGAAADCGVKTFVFLSSVRAMGLPDGTCVDETYLKPAESEYGRSKRAAEEEVLAYARKYARKVVILRPCLVYGAGAKGNLLRMANWVRRGVFPPLPETGNRRSLVHVNDLVSAIACVIQEPLSAGRTYIVVGPDAASGRELLVAMHRALGKRTPNWQVPLSWLNALADFGDLFFACTRRQFPFNGDVFARLLSSAEYSGQLISQETGWYPVVTLEHGLKEMLSC